MTEFISIKLEIDKIKAKEIQADYFYKYDEYVKSQIGNPEGEDLPNKKYYDPRKWLREGELTFKTRLIKSFKDLNNIGRNKQ